MCLALSRVPLTFAASTDAAFAPLCGVRLASASAGYSGWIWPAGASEHPETQNRVDAGRKKMTSNLMSYFLHQQCRRHASVIPGFYEFAAAWSRAKSFSSTAHAAATAESQKNVTSIRRIGFGSLDPATRLSRMSGFHDVLAPLPALGVAMPPIRLTILFSLLALGFGCANNDAVPSALAPGAPLVSELERFFPLVDGKLYAYLGRSDGAGANGVQSLVVLRVERKGRDRGILRGSSLERTFLFADKSVSRVGGGMVLALPLREGAVFLGDHGGRTTIAETSANIDAPSGHYSGCLRTEEEPSLTYAAKVLTTFCPGVGIVRLEVVAPNGKEVLELQSYGDPVVIR
jgi:hypothetical protein